MNQLLAKVRILVVDDDQEILDTYEELLTILGFTVATALNGQIAWALMQKSEFDVVFSDIRMPVMDGIELLKKIRSRDKVWPCVLITSAYNDYPADTLYQLGANGYLAKPVVASSIREALTRALLRTEDLWQHGAHIAPTAKIGKRFKSFNDLIGSGEVHFGNGGFCFHQASPNAALHAAVGFSFGFDDNRPFKKIEGIGVVQWVHRYEAPDRPRGLGIEIKYLSDGCREMLCQWIRNQKFDAFIPIK